MATRPTECTATDEKPRSTHPAISPIKFRAEQYWYRSRRDRVARESHITVAGELSMITDRYRVAADQAFQRFQVSGRLQNALANTNGVGRPNRGRVPLQLPLLPYHAVARQMEGHVLERNDTSQMVISVIFFDFWAARGPLWNPLN